VFFKRFYKFQRIGPQLKDPFVHFFHGFGKQFGIGGTDMKHLQPITPYTDFIQQYFCVLHSFPCSEISFQEMTITDLSPAQEDGIRPGLKRFQNMNRFDFAGAKIFDNPDRPRVLQPLGTGHIRGSVCAVGTQQRDNFRLKIFHSILHGIYSAINILPQRA